MFMFQTLKLVPGGENLGVENEALAVLAFSLAGLLGLLVPFIDRGVERKGRSPVFTWIGVAAVIYIAIFTAVGYHAWWPVWLTLVLGLGPWILSHALFRHKPASR